MAKANNLTQTVDKLDQALARLELIQSALRVESTGDEKATQSNNFNGSRDNRRIQLGNQILWSKFVPLVPENLSDAVAVSKFAKKTVDMVKVQKKKHAAKISSTATLSSLQLDETSILCPSNRANFCHRVDMSGSADAGRKPRESDKENKMEFGQSKSELKSDAPLQMVVGGRSTLSMKNARSGKCREFAVLASSHADMLCPEQDDMKQSVLKLKALDQVEVATIDPLVRPTDGVNANKQEDKKPSKLKATDKVDVATNHLARARDAINVNVDDHGSAINRTSFSMRTLMRIEDEEEKQAQLDASKTDRDVDTFNPAVPSKSFSVALGEIKPSKRKSWSFTHQGKGCDNMIVMFRNPAFDEMTSSTSIPLAYEKKRIPAKCLSIHEIAPALTSTMAKNEAHSLQKKGSITPRKEKIVRLSPCIINKSFAQNLQPQAGSTVVACASLPKTSSLSIKKQKWLHSTSVPHPPSPILIRKLPNFHETKEIKQTRQNRRDEEGRQITVRDCSDDPSKRSWTFGNPSMHGEFCNLSEMRRSSTDQNPPGNQAFSFLSKHFNAWKLASNEPKE